MTTPATIRYFKSQEIDKTKWDNCIESADNGLIYAQSYYLDVMARNWDALILGDYDAVMPLTWNRKYGFYYLYQPYFLPSLGVFKKSNINISLLEFLKMIPSKFRYIDLDLNELNSFAGSERLPGFSIIRRVNYLLNLNQNYSKLKSGYSRLCRRCITKAAQSNIAVTSECCPADVIDFYRKHYESKHEKITVSAYSKLLTAASICFEKGRAKIYMAKLSGGEIAAAYLVLLDNNYIYSLLGGSSLKGKQTGSFYLLTDAIIKDYAESGRVFRFEGSDIQGVAFFNEQFGAVKTYYFRLQKNSLPFPLNLLKRH